MWGGHSDSLPIIDARVRNFERRVCAIDQDPPDTSTQNILKSNLQFVLISTGKETHIDMKD